MLSKAALDFLLRLTDWFHGHWEDPEWGKRPTTQILIALALRDLATASMTLSPYGRIQAAADTVVEKNSQVMSRV